MDKRTFYSQRYVSRRYDRLRFGGPGGEWVSRRELTLVRSLLPPGGRVLDLACGTGRSGLLLAECGYDVVGLDASGEMLEIARNKAAGKPVRWLQGDAFILPFAPQSFDAVVALRLAFHYPSIVALLRSVASAIRPGGAFVFDTLNWSPRAVAGLGHRTWGPKVYVHSPSAVTTAGHELGFEVGASQACFLVSPYVYALLPPPILRVLAWGERFWPAPLKARVFWRLEASAQEGGRSAKDAKAGRVHEGHEGTRTWGTTSDRRDTVPAVASAARTARPQRARS